MNIGEKSANPSTVDREDHPKYRRFIAEALGLYTPADARDSNAAPPAAAAPTRRHMFGVLTALAAAPLVLSPRAQAMASTLQPIETGDAELMAIGERLDALEREIAEAETELIDARARFDANAPPRPPELVWDREKNSNESLGCWCLDMNIDGTVAHRGPGGLNRVVINIDRLVEELPHYSSRTKHGKWLRRTLAQAREHEAATEAAVKDSGYPKAVERSEALYGQLDELARPAFDIEPTTL